MTAKEKRMTLERLRLAMGVVWVLLMVAVGILTFNGYLLAAIIVGVGVFVWVLACTFVEGRIERNK